MTHARRGIGMVEILVTIGVASILVAIILPAILRARAASRLATCKSRLHQIGVATHSYESTHGHYMHELEPNGIDRHEPLFSLLDFMDQNNLRKSCETNKEKGWGYPGMYLTLPAFRCPSMLSVDALQYQINYGVPTRWGPVKHGVRKLEHWENGMHDHEPLKSNDIRDGISNTAFFSEGLAQWDVTRSETRDEALARDVRYYRWKVPGEPVHLDLSRNEVELRRSNAKNLEYSGRKGRSIGYSHIPLPNQLSPRFRLDAAGSHHDGGVNVLMVDGSVRFVNDDVSADVWRAIGTRDGAEVFSNDDF